MLFHDAQYGDKEYPSHVGWGHSAIDHVMKFAQKADVDTIVFFHHDPYHDDDAVDNMVIEARNFFPNTTGASRDLTIFLDEQKSSTEGRAEVQKTMETQVLKTSEFPRVTFESTSIEQAGSGGQLRVHGNLTIRGKTQPVVIPLTLTDTTPAIVAPDEGDVMLTVGGWVSIAVEL